VSARKPTDCYEVKDGEWLPIGGFRYHECCDCGLVHEVRTRIHDGVMQEQWTRKQPRQPRRSRKAKA
jgi:hypothetical protein